MKKYTYAVIVVGLCGLLLGVWTWYTLPTQRINMADRPHMVLLGFHEPEEFGGEQMRWSRAESSMRVVQPAAGIGIWQLRLRNSYPADVASPQVRINWGDSTIFEGSVATQRTYAWVVSQRPQVTWYQTVTIQSSTYTSVTDPRELGVVVSTAQYIPSRDVHGLALIHVISLVVLLGLIGVVGSMLAYPVWLNGGILVIVASVVLWYGQHDMLGVWPFLYIGVCIAALVAGGVWLVRRIYGVAGRLTGSDVALVAVAGWWAAAALQAVQRVTGVENGARPEMVWFAVIQCVVLVIAVIWWRWRAPHVSWQQVIWPAVTIGSLVIGVYGMWYTLGRDGTDFWILFKGAREWVRGGSFYDMQAVAQNHVGAVFKVPPFYGMLFAPFVFADGLQVLWWYRVLNMILAVGAVLIWWRTVQPSRQLIGPVVSLVALYRPFVDTIGNGQIDVMLWFLLSVSYWALRRQQQGVAGVMIALATLFKIYPVIVLAFFVIKGHWRSIVGFVLGMFVIHVVSISIVGWPMHGQYLFEVLPQIGGTTSWVENQTISAVMARWADTPFEARILADDTLTRIGLGVSMLIAAWFCVLALRNEVPTSITYGLQYGAFALMMVWIVPTAWMHYQTIIAVLFLLMVVQYQTQSVSIVWALWYAASYGLIAFGNQWSFNNRVDYGLVTQLGVSYKFYGLVILAVLVSLQILRSHADWQTPWVRWIQRLRTQNAGQ